MPPKKPPCLFPGKSFPAPCPERAARCSARACPPPALDRGTTVLLAPQLSVDGEPTRSLSCRPAIPTSTIPDQPLSAVLLDNLHRERLEDLVATRSRRTEHSLAPTHNTRQSGLDLGRLQQAHDDPLELSEERRAERLG